MRGCHNRYTAELDTIEAKHQYKPNSTGKVLQAATCAWFYVVYHYTLPPHGCAAAEAGTQIQLQRSLVLMALPGLPTPPPSSSHSSHLWLVMRPPAPQAVGQYHRLEGTEKLPAGEPAWRQHAHGYLRSLQVPATVQLQCAQAGGGGPASATTRPVYLPACSVCVCV